jgi:hypothetical protein
MPYTPDRTDLGLDAQPDWTHAAALVGQPLAAIAFKINPTPSTWSVGGWRYIGTQSWVDVDAAGVCYAQGHVHLPPT